MKVSTSIRVTNETLDDQDTLIFLIKEKLLSVQNQRNYKRYDNVSTELINHGDDFVKNFITIILRADMYK